MPVDTFPGKRNWGYDGAFLYAPQRRTAGPRGCDAWSTRATPAGWRCSSTSSTTTSGPEGNYLRDYGPYFTDRYRTPWGSAMNFDGEDSDEVRRFFLDNALHWLTSTTSTGCGWTPFTASSTSARGMSCKSWPTTSTRQAARLGRSLVWSPRAT